MMNKLIKISAIFAAMACSQVMAAPTGAAFTMGEGSVVQNGKETIITTSIYNDSNPNRNYMYLIEWNSLDLAEDEQLTLNCQGLDSIKPYVILKVLPGNASHIDGKIFSSNCRILLANPDGIALSDTAVVDALSFVGVAASSVEPYRFSDDASYYSYNYMELTSAPVTATNKTTFLNIGGQYNSDYPGLVGTMRFNVADGITAHTPILLNPNSNAHGVVFTGSGSMQGDSVFGGSSMTIVPSIPTVLSGRILTTGIGAPRIIVEPTNNNLYSIGALSITGTGASDTDYSAYLEFGNAKSAKDMVITNLSPQNISLNFYNQPSDLSGIFNRVNMKVWMASWTGNTFNCGQLYDNDHNPFPMANDNFSCTNYTMIPDIQWGVTKRPLAKSISVTEGMLSLRSMSIPVGVTAKSDRGGSMEDVLNEGTLDIGSLLKQCEAGWDPSIGEYKKVPCSTFKITGPFENKGMFYFSPMSTEYNNGGVTIKLINSGTMKSKSDGSLALSSLINDGTIKSYGTITYSSNSGSGTVTASGKVAQDYILRLDAGDKINVENKAGGVIDLLYTIAKPIAQPIAQPIAKPIAQPIAQPIAKPITTAPVIVVQSSAKTIIKK